MNHEGSPKSEHRHHPASPFEKPPFPKTATVAEQVAHVAPDEGSSKKGTTRQKGAPKGQWASIPTT
jgi:hypothetical protein